MPRPKPSVSRARRDEWEVHRRELSRLFIVDGVPVAQIAKYMKEEHGFDKKPKDYEYRLKKWNLRRNLHESELISIQSQLSRREQAGRPSEIVVSGIRWSESMVRGRLERHKSRWPSTEPFEAGVLPDFLARVQTPSPLMKGLPEWPKELPWLEFNRSIHRALATLTTASTAGQLSRPRGQGALLVQMMRFCTTARYPKTAVPVQVESINPPTKMRAMLEVLAPQVHPGDHETTADILHTGSYESLAVELIRLLIYFESNNMGDRFRDLLGFQVDLATPANMMNFLKELGFLTKANLDWLGHCIDPTSQAFLNRLLAHAIIDENSLDVLKMLIPNHFNVNHLLNTSKHQWFTLDMGPPQPRVSKALRRYNANHTLLSVSCFVGNIKAVRLLLDLGADPYGTSGLPSPTPLESAADLACHERATTITSLLLSKQTTSSAQVRNAALERALQTAIVNSNKRLVMKLLSERERVGGGSICSEHFTIAARRADSATIRLLVDNAQRNTDGHVQLPKDILFSIISDLGPDLRDQKMYDELFEKFNYLLELGVDPAVPRCRCGVVGSFCLEFLLLPTVGIGNSASLQEECAFKMAAAMRKHGCPPERPKSTSSGDPPTSVLQLAIGLGYTQLVEYLLDWGADIDFFKDVSKSAAPGYKDCQCIDGWYPNKGCSPLLTALEYGRTEIVKILLKHRPNLKLRGGELLLAIQNCEPEEVAMLLFVEPQTDDEWEICFQRAVSMRKPKLIELLLPKSSNGRAEIDPSTIMRAALVTGEYDRAYQMATVCGYDSETLFESVLQSHKGRVGHTIVDHLLQMRPNTPNDDFEIRAVAFAAMHHDMYILNRLMESFGQGPWIADFPPREMCLSNKVPFGSRLERPGLHILSFAAELGKIRKDDTVLKALLQSNVSAKGTYIDDPTYFSEETLSQLIVSGMDPNQVEFLFNAVKNNALMHVRALCEAKFDLKALHTHDRNIAYFGQSRAAIQVAVEEGSPEMLEMLLHYGADVDHPAGFYRGATCLQLAAGAGNIGLVRLLINKGATLYAKRSLLKGRTAVEIAAENGRLDMLKLLLLQEQHLFRTVAERYQFIRAAKMAEQNGHEVIGKMLRQHIHWNSKDQGLFDEISCHQDFTIHLDDMTQKVTESEKCDVHFWQYLRGCCRDEGLPDLHNIDGIEQWVGEIPDEYSSDDSDLESETSFSSEEEASFPSSDTLATARQQGAGRDEQASGCGHHSDLLPMYDNTDDTMGWSEDLKVEPTNEQPGARFQATSMDPASGQEETALAPLAIRRDDRVPAWLDMEDNMYDSADVAMLEDSGYQSASGNPLRTPGLALGEVQVSQINNMGDGIFGIINGEEGYVDVDQSLYFDWGFWGEDGIGRQLADLDLGCQPWESMDMEED